MNSSTSLELNKILSACSEYAVLDSTKSAIVASLPSSELAEVRTRLALTAEADVLLYRYGIGKPEYYPDVTDLIVRSSKGSALTCGELLDCNRLLRSARCVYSSVVSSGDDITLFKNLTRNLYFDENLERDITEKILSTDKVSDNASEALFSIRSKIKSLNERIRSTLSEYMSGKDSQYLQESLVTMRGDRYVIPVKAEAKNKVKGFVHDRSASGQTFFIEPEYVLNLNNELVALTIDEKEEVERILKSLSARVGAMKDKLLSDMEILTEADGYLARAEYAYSVKAVRPAVNNRGYVNIVRGRHPLIDKNKAVPVSVGLGGDYSFLLLSGANTGGKTVTLKMVGLFCLMAECGMFLPAADGTEVSVFKKIFCDVGDSQSVEESLSTFSGHITKVIEICNEADGESLALIDELGGGTNPDEGQAIASAVTEHLLKAGAKGIITTHFTALKEFAYSLGGIQNAAMQFDSVTLKPLYTIKIGAAGASNALAISRRLGMPQSVLTAAEGYLSAEGRHYDNIIKRAEIATAEAEAAKNRTVALEAEWAQKCEEAKKTLAKLERERAALTASARTESRRIINERTARAEELVAEIEKILNKNNLAEADLIYARTLKNRTAAEKDEEGFLAPAVGMRPAEWSDIKVGAEVYVEALAAVGTVQSFNERKDGVEVLSGSIKLRVKLSGLKVPQGSPRKGKQPNNSAKKAENVRVVKKFSPGQPTTEINVIGMTSDEAVSEVQNFIDRAVTDNLEQVKIIHGVGTGKLRTAIAAYLKRCRSVKEFRSGRYGEGEIGVTIVTLR